MKRDGDKILFDSDLQQTAFEDAMHGSRGAEMFVQKMLEAMSRASRDAQAYWAEVEKLFGENESAYYHWPTRELRVTKFAAERTDKQTP